MLPDLTTVASEHFYGTHLHHCPGKLLRPTRTVVCIAHHHFPRGLGGEQRLIRREQPTVADQPLVVLAVQTKRRGRVKRHRWVRGGRWRRTLRLQRFSVGRLHGRVLLERVIERVQTLREG